MLSYVQGPTLYVPSKNTIRNFGADQMYHLYNRGVDKRVIFLDEQDYAVFLSLLKHALLPPEHKDKDADAAMFSQAQRVNIRRTNLAGRIDLMAYCLMPNHFHLLVYQHDSEAITALMRSIGTGYSMYFNKRYERVGTLFQGKYKASLIDHENYWAHISRYIHLNPIDLKKDFKTYPYSSYQAYTGHKEIEWIKPDRVLDGFQGPNDYVKFVADYKTRRNELKEIDKTLVP